VCRVCCSYALHRTAYYVAFGPHGPRAPVNPPGTVVKILTGISVLVGTAGLIYAGIRSIGVLARSIFHPIVLTSTLFLFFALIKKNAQLHRHPSRSARSGKRLPTSARRNSKSTPSQVRTSFVFYFAIFSIPCYPLAYEVAMACRYSSEGYSGKGFVKHK
jgi:hypothetical protein